MTSPPPGRISPVSAVNALIETTSTHFANTRVPLADRLLNSDIQELLASLAFLSTTGSGSSEPAAGAGAARCRKTGHQPVWYRSLTGIAQAASHQSGMPESLPQPTESYPPLFDLETASRRASEPVTLNQGMPTAPAIPPPPPPLPIQTAQSGAPPDRIPRWLQQAELFLRVIVRLYVGLIVCCVPWLPFFWDNNPLFSTSPSLQAFIAHGAVRGLVSGIGLLNLWIAIRDAIGSPSGPSQPRNF